MNIIRTWQQLEDALASEFDPSVHQILTDTRDRLADFNDQPLSELCSIVILEPDDRLELDPTTAEYIACADGWFELVFVLSDDGRGTVAIVEDRPDGDQTLLDHCRANQTD